MSTPALPEHSTRLLTLPPVSWFLRYEDGACEGNEDGRAWNSIATPGDLDGHTLFFTRKAVAELILDDYGLTVLPQKPAPFFAYARYAALLGGEEAAPPFWRFTLFGYATETHVFLHQARSSRLISHVLPRPLAPDALPL